MTPDGQGLAVVTHAEYIAAFANPALFPYRGGPHGAQRLVYMIGTESSDGASVLPPPSLQSRAVVAMYAERDGWTCHLCDTLTDPAGKHVASPDHLTPRSLGGSDYPSNIRTSHLSCNKSRRNAPLAHGTISERVPTSSLIVGVPTHDRKGREGKGDRKGGGSRSLRIPNSPSAPSLATTAPRSPMPTAATGDGR